MSQKMNIDHISKDKFEFANNSDIMHDKKLQTKQMSFFQDVFMRFCKNKSSVVATVIILILVLFAIVGPFFVNTKYAEAYTTDTLLVNYKLLPPKLAFLEGTGVWDGTAVEEISLNKYNTYIAMEMERGTKIIEEVLGRKVTVDAFGKVSATYTVRVNKYTSINTYTQTLTYDEYKAIMDYQDATGIQVILPRVDAKIAKAATVGNLNVWFACNQKGKVELDKDGNFIPAYYTTGKDDYTSKVRLENDPGDWKYAQRTGSAETGYNYVVRLDPSAYFMYRYEFEPNFAFGTDSRGFDIFSRLASGARFSFILAVVVSAINLFIGAIYGAIEGYYGGVVDMVMERISDILSGVPFTVVTVLFSLHLASKIGIVPSLLFAFVSTGWIGMASRVRMQFYRFKNQEYVLAARTLGASDGRIMFKHIFPNSLGTIITGSVLSIPGVIFSETSLSYLGIINLNSTTLTSIGAMLSEGQGCMTTSPHVVLFPAIFIALLMICFNLFGNGLRDAFNPSTRGVD